MIRSTISFLAYLLILNLFLFAQSADTRKLDVVNSAKIITGASQIDIYLPILKDKRVGLVANHSSLIGSTHLVDTLLSLGVDIIRVYSPEHGFRGDFSPGSKVKNFKDPKTGISIISLYGKKHKPTRRDLRRIDIMLYDIQDVGVRFYTYISTMSYVMEACAEHGIPVIILDRPNPNGFYVDGPVLDKKYISFVGLHPVPIVYGMTCGEYALMVNNEGWLKNGVKCELSVISLLNYTHNQFFELPVRPSPNLPNMYAIYLYPSLALFEGTIISVGRGTDNPFQVIGHPDFLIGDFEFTPTSRPGAEYPKYRDQKCQGINLKNYALNFEINPKQLNLQWLREMYLYFDNKDYFFNDYFNYLAGNRVMKEQIALGMSEEQIRQSWQPELQKFMEIRKKYLLYPDFEDYGSKE